MIVASLLVVGGALAASGGARGALGKPTYSAGDRWVYVLVGSLDELPGANATVAGNVSLGLTGIVEVHILGPATGLAGGVRAETHASGFLNGTLEFAGNTTINVSGTFSSDSVEVWEGQDYLPVISNSTMNYVIDVKVLFVTTPVKANLWLNATTSYGALPPFNLSVGESASASFTSDLTVATSFSAFGFGQHMSNTTSAAGVWTRQVLSRENVTVEAGTFSAYRLNESLGAFPGISVVAPISGANETAWFSNDVGNYVKRVAYVNGTPVAEMRLKSYTTPATPAGLSLTDVLLLVAVPIAVVVVLLALLVRRRRRPRDATKASSGAGPVGELPPKPPGANP